MVFNIIISYFDNGYSVKIQRLFTKVTTSHNFEKKSIYLWNPNVIAVHCNTTRDVFVMSFFHGNGENVIKRHADEILKPNMFKIVKITWALNRYKQHMSYYALERESRKLWKKYF